MTLCPNTTQTIQGHKQLTGAQPFVAGQYVAFLILPDMQTF